MLKGMQHVVRLVAVLLVMTDLQNGADATFKKVKKPIYLKKPYGTGIGKPAPYPHGPNSVKPVQREPSHSVHPHGPACPKIHNLQSRCRPAKDCAVWNLVRTSDDIACKLADGDSIGACCPDLPVNGHGLPLEAESKEIPLRHDIDIEAINDAVDAGRDRMRHLEEIEQKLMDANTTVSKRSSPYSHLLFFRTTDDARMVSRGALLAVETARQLAQRLKLSADEAGFGLSAFSLMGTPLEDVCPIDGIVHCDGQAPSAYRTMDGSCNNLRRPGWGRSMTPLRRILTPHYADGVWQTRDDLPSGRLVSASVVPDVDAPHQSSTLWVMQYGQFLDHDFSNTPVFRLGDDKGITCCTEDGQLIDDSQHVHPACLPIDIPEDDPHYQVFGQRCMNFVRSTPAPRNDCKFGHAEQMNPLTSFLDSSNVYGTAVKEAHELRTFRGGALKAVSPYGHPELPLLPSDHETDTNCSLPESFAPRPPAEVKCFKAGDERVNQQPTLAVTHTIFMRQHNRLAAQLAELNPQWDDERLYQEARRILIAQMQHITYNEWLPVIIGPMKMQQLGLVPLAHGFSDDYDDHLDPSVINEFVTAAYRFGHSLIQGRNYLFGRDRTNESEIVLHRHFSKTQSLYYPGHLDKYLIGLSVQPMQNMDHYFTESVTNHLFEEEGRGFGLDLVSLNIQRGRDHGLQGYNAYRTLCGLPRAKSFRDLVDHIPHQIVERFQLLYEHVDDIDLFIGGVSEKPAPDSLIGPTFQCLVSEQFLRFKRADRYFYDLGGQAGSFTEAQLTEIRQTSFARLVCDNSDVRRSQPLIFKSISPGNPVVDCQSPSIPRMNLTPWQNY